MKALKAVMLPLRVKRITKTARLPLKGSTNAAGYDLCADEDIAVPAGSKALVSTGLSMAIPQGYYGRVAPRSGLAVKNFIDIGAGVIDADYRGEVKVLLFNFGKEDFPIKRGDRIAQLVIEVVAPTEIVETEDLDNTERGEGGFGSTGTDWKHKEEEPSK
jgi:dUTP pyrophosphatase